MSGRYEAKRKQWFIDQMKESSSLGLFDRGYDIDELLHNNPALHTCVNLYANGMDNMPALIADLCSIIKDQQDTMKVMYENQRLVIKHAIKNI